jgi:hypothetical protein
MPLHIDPKRDGAWLRYASALTDEPVYTCREPTPIERLAAAGFTRRVSGALVWFAHADGRTTPKRATVEAAIGAALEVVNDNT